MNVAPDACSWTVEVDELAVICRREAVMQLIVIGGRDRMPLCRRHADEVLELPTVALADDRTLVMRWA